MSLSDELLIQDLLNKSEFFQDHLEENESYKQESEKCIQQVFDKLNENVRNSMENYSAQIIVRFTEVALRIKGKEKLAQTFNKIFFQYYQSGGQFFVRSLLVKAQIISFNGQQKCAKAENMISILKESMVEISKAIEIINKPENKIKYAFLTFNISVCVYDIIKDMLKSQWAKHFVDQVEKIEKLLEEVDDTDSYWRSRFTYALFLCLYDADKKPDAFKILDRLFIQLINNHKFRINLVHIFMKSAIVINILLNTKFQIKKLFNQLSFINNSIGEFTKKKSSPKTVELNEFQEQLLRLRVSYGKELNTLVAAVKKDADTAPKDLYWNFLVQFQSIKCGMIPEPQIEKELLNVINSISGSILNGTDTSGSQKLNPVLQLRLVEAGRLALQFNLVNTADQIISFTTRVRQLDVKAYILNEYNKAEILVKKAGPLMDEKTGMRLKSIQIKQLEIDRRIEALRILEKVMFTNKKVYDPYFIYEGAVLVWNIGLPFLNANYRQYVQKVFLSVAQLLEQTQCNDHALRINFHLELAKSAIEDDLMTTADEHLTKSLLLDSSISLGAIKEKNEPDEDMSLYQRPYDRYLKLLKDKVSLKINSDQATTDIETIIVGLNSAANAQSQNTRVDSLQKCLKIIENHEDKKYFYDSAKGLVEPEIKAEEKKWYQDQVRDNKQRVLLAAEIGKMAFEWDINNLAEKACKFVFQNDFEVRNATEVIIAQIECYYIMAQCVHDELINQGYETSYLLPIKISEDEGGNDEEDKSLSQEQQNKLLEQKNNIISYFLKGLKLAESVNQTWLVFNGAINIWNNYLDIFKHPINDSKLLPRISDLLKEFFDIMKTSLKQLEEKNITDFDIESKIQVFANIGLVYARLMEGKSQYDTVMQICESLLSTPLNPMTRKLINSTKARVQGVSKNAPGGKAPDKGGKKGEVSPKETKNEIDQVVFDVVAQLELIQNQTNKASIPDMIKNCYELLQSWNPKLNDETEIELHAELWCRLARLSLDAATPLMTKYCLRCVEYSLSLINSTSLDSVPSNRLRWYSLSEYLYSETLVRMINPQAQEIVSQEQLLFNALKHAVESSNYGYKSQLNSLVIDASKQVWNICAKLQSSAKNRKLLTKPIFCTIANLKMMKEKSEPDLVLLLSQLLFQSCQENEEYQMGENCADMSFELVPKNLQKPIWDAKMIFMSKQGKNELVAINNMKEGDPSLMAKIWIRLARTTSNVYKQYTAFNKAIEILKKEGSVELVEVLIEFSEWLIRNNYEKQLVEENLLMGADILIEIEKGDEDEEDDDQKSQTIFSRSSRGKKSKMSKESSSNKSSQLKKTNGISQKQDSVSISKKSKKGANSRSSRKTKQSSKSKSIFSQRNEDPLPESLNCIHYERLMRIHVMLSLIANTSEKQIQFALDAKFFMIKMIELSFDSMNRISQALKKSNEQSQVQNILMPQKIEDWMNLQFPKEFLEYIKTASDSNLISKFVFDKAEMTCYYAETIIQVLEDFGLHLHTVPVYVFLRFLASEIIQFSSYQQALDAKFAKTLCKIGFNQKAEEILKNIQFQNIEISDQMKMDFLNKTIASKIQENQETQEGVKALQIKKQQIHQMWILMAKQLFDYGEIAKSRELFQEALKHASELKENSLICEIHFYMGQIYYLEGQFQNSLNVNYLN